MAKYSIILPVRNGGPYLKECVASVLAQTYTNFNFIILDNNSTDGSLEWLNDLRDDRIKIIISQNPLTIEESWSRILDVEKNEFITLIGHDDILYPNFLMVIDKLILNYPQASLFHTHFNFIDAQSQIIRPCKKMNIKLSGYEFLIAFLTQSIDSMGTGYVMRAKDYDALNGIPINYPNLLFADFELWLKLSFKSNEVIAPENCFAFRVHQSTTGTSQDIKLHRALEIFTDFLESLSKQDPAIKNIIDQYGIRFLLYYCKGFSHRLLRTPLKQRANLSVKEFITFTKTLAFKLGILNNYYPEKLRSVQLALTIDGNIVLSYLFLLFKKIYSKPLSN